MRRKGMCIVRSVLRSIQHPTQLSHPRLGRPNTLAQDLDTCLAPVPAQPFLPDKPDLGLRLARFRRR